MKKLLVAMLVFGISLGLIGTSFAQDRGKKNGGKKQMRNDARAKQGPGRNFLKDEDMRKEFERFEKEMQELAAKRKELRQTVEKAIKEAEKKAGKPLTPDQVKTVIAGYRDKIIDIMTQFVDAQVKHHRNQLDIVEKKKQAKIQEMVDRFLQGPQGKPGRQPQPGQQQPQPGENQPQPDSQPSGDDDFWGE